MALLLAACATGPQPMTVRSDVDALTTADAQNKQRFVILPGGKEVSEQDLQFIEFKTYVEKVLINRGFSKASSLRDGDMVLFLSYGVGAPQMYQYAYEVPVWNDMGYYPFYSRRYRYYPMMSTYYTQRIETYTLYKRYLSLDAYDMEAYLQQQTPRQLWKISVQSEGRSNDLRLTFPYMVTAMQPYIGTNTGHMLAVDVDEFNPVLRQITMNIPLPSVLPASQPIKVQ
ncbi:hypothetical protein IVG45_06640 [Methylomonas sp. LL1]|nr:hypothetical protein IVG45_06640 [Methylomonas sp. LL1]